MAKKQQLPGEPVKAVVKLVERAAHVVHDQRRTFEALVEMCYCALAQRSPGHSVPSDKLEARYMAAIKPWAENEERHAFPEAMSLLVQHVRGRDLLGSVAGELSALNGYMGQFFTPYDMSRLIAQMTLHDAKGVVAEKGYITLCEPACGSGGMVLAAADAMEGMGHAPGTTMLVEATDLSDLAFKMCYVQLCARGVPALVRWGDSLSGEVKEWAWTGATRAFALAHPSVLGAKPAYLPPRRRTRVGVAV